MNKAIITGGAGFVGSVLTRKLQETYPDAELLVIDDFRVGNFQTLCSERDALSADGFSFKGELIARPLHEVDLLGLAEDFAPDCIFHQASITDTTVDDQALMLQHNIEPFADLLQIATQSETKLVWASSAATYGQTANGKTPAKKPFTLDDAGKPANVYGFSKWVMENMHRQATTQYPDAHIVGLRYFNVFGPNEQFKGKMASMIYQLAMKMIAGEQPRIFHDGSQARDQVYVLDIVGANLAAASDEAKSGIYNAGSGETTSFNQIVEALNEALDTDFKPEYFENPFSFYQDYTCADLSATKSGLSWSPAHPPRKAIIEYGRALKALHK